MYSDNFVVVDGTNDPSSFQAYAMMSPWLLSLPLSAGSLASHVATQFQLKGTLFPPPLLRPPCVSHHQISRGQPQHVPEWPLNFYSCYNPFIIHLPGDLSVYKSLSFLNIFSHCTLHKKPKFPMWPIMGLMSSSPFNLIFLQSPCASPPCSHGCLSTSTEKLTPALEPPSLLSHLAGMRSQNFTCLGLLLIHILDQMPTSRFSPNTLFNDTVSRHYCLVHYPVTFSSLCL